MPTTLYASDGTHLRFDSAVEVRVTASDTVTRHPTEVGVVISDHVQRDPRLVSILATFTETPTSSQLADHGATDGLSGEARVRAAMGWLEDHRAQRLTLVSDGLDDLDDLVILRLPNEVTVVRRRTLTLELQEVLTAEAGEVRIPPEAPRPVVEHALATAQDLGEQATVSGDSDPDQQVRDTENASVLYSFLNRGG